MSILHFAVGLYFIFFAFLTRSSSDAEITE